MSKALNDFRLKLAGKEYVPIIVGGIGVDISCLRPKDSLVHNAADSSTGAVSFMELYSLTTGLIGQSGRRGALMLTIDVKHPDIQRFIKVKKCLTG